MEEMNKLNDEVLEGVAGGMLSRNQALAKALKREGLNKNQVDYVEQSGAILKYERDYDD